jgi:hypothetical protein
MLSISKKGYPTELADLTQNNNKTSRTTNQPIRSKMFTKQIMFTTLKV